MAFKLICLPSKIIAGFMAFSNLMFSLVATIAASVKLVQGTSDHANNLYFTLAIIMGLLNFLIALVLITAIVKGNERYVFYYLVLELSNLIIITIFAGINTYQSVGIGLLFFVCIVHWYGLYCMYYYYLELAEYNNVKSGVIEITCNSNNINPVMFPEKAVESTAV